VKLGIIGIIFSIRTYLGLCFILFILLSNNFYTAIALNFMLLGIGRYIKGLPLGFGIDGILVLTYIALFMNKFKEK
jgi:predicted MFS family arabinose efflux permease